MFKRHWHRRDNGDDAMWSFEKFCNFVSATAWRWKQGHAIPDQKSWDLILDVLAGSMTWTSPYFTWNATIMFYYYYSRRKPVGPQARREEWTGYTGVLQGIIAEIPTRRREWLQRTLSLDIHHFFPTFIKDENHCRRMVAIARRLAIQNGCNIALPSRKATPETPPPETWNSRAWVAALFGFAPTRSSLEDEESRADGGFRNESSVI
ncbi:hypothetical protein N657DRAFT_681311 [Parathielavia appendiculata]|uniref:Uncharacterized protein n=1 Tax=Parathielavia appendiculata TaxID=2587402 RepID=A0AAN6TYM2_9PEZI|nr:hypothetical protein N657DRAFT_681311 [Parathielavia appendiculata]